MGLFHLECISTCDPETNAVLCSILEMMKEQFVYSHRLHGWIIAVAETLEKHPILQPSYYGTHSTIKVLPHFCKRLMYVFRTSTR